MHRGNKQHFISKKAPKTANRIKLMKHSDDDDNDEQKNDSE